MKKIITLAAASVLAASTFSAQAQITLDGKVSAAEIGAANTGKYVLVGSYTQTHGYGDYGITKLYVANTATKVYMFLQSAVENNNALQIYMDLPGVTGIAKGTALPGGTAASGTSFEKMKAKMDLETDLGIAIQATATGQKINAISYVGTVSDKQVTPILPTDGSVVTLNAVSLAPIAQLVGARMAYLKSSTGKLSAVTNEGWEIELDRTALGLPNTGMTTQSTINIFAIESNGGGDYLSSDMIPEIPGNNGANLNESAKVDFTALAGTQSVAVQLASALATRGEVATSLRFGMYPNPGSTVTVNYTVPNSKQAVDLSVFDATGKKVRLMSEAQVGEQAYKLSGLRAGIYVVKLNVGGQQTSSKLIIE